MTNENLCSFVSNRLKITDNLEEICNQVLDTCLHKGSRDNMSLILITLPNCPKPSAEEIKKEEELESNLRKIIKGKFI